ncbi:MAG TPA: hypothetical protein VHU84_14450 [Lacipirellulaceae bacterium]|jgi:hypothetical protein|nr:hypothetical protein [Lacipirellulaceae bacterium]
MPANIRIESGIAAGTNYWIDRPVLRVGSDPQCEICLPTADLAPHALTVEFGGGTYRAYNRGSMPISLGRTTLQPGASGAWDDGDMASLPGDQRLVLSINGDPSPCPRPEKALDDGFDNDPAAAASDTPALTPEEIQKAKSKSLMQMGIIGICVAGMGGLLMMNKMLGGTETPPPNRPSFNKIVTDSLTKDAAIRELVQKLQFAQSFIVRGDPENARVQFGELRDQLLRHMDSLSTVDRKDAEVIRDYVDGKLGDLQ